MTIDFGAACSDLFKTKQKWQTLLLLSVCILIPVVGQIVVMGYLYRRHASERAGIPAADFDFSDFGEHLQAGLWPFLSGLVASLVAIPVLMLTMLPIFLGPLLAPENEAVILIGFAASFGYIMTMMQIPLKITTLFTSFSSEAWVILACINIMLLVLGTLMDMAPLILILTPILLPVIKSIGIDPVHFGMIMMVNLCIGQITPPVGAVLFVGSAVAKLKIEQVVRAMKPFFVILLFVLVLVTYVPQISLWLPRSMGL
jgi:hypothetical protein